MTFHSTPAIRNTDKSEQKCHKTDMNPDRIRKKQKQRGQYLFSNSKFLAGLGENMDQEKHLFY